MSTTFYSNGKLLITGEYAVLKGARAFAIPTRFGQSLTVTETDSGFLNWKSYDVDKNCWLEALFSIDSLELRSEVSHESEVLKQLLQLAKKINPSFLKTSKGFEIETHLEFSRSWGLGSSSTLLNNIAQWAEIDPYKLLKNRFSGSGYDIACAQVKKPIVYQLKDGSPKATPVRFDPPFKNDLFFVYLNKKQNSSAAILDFQSKSGDKKILTSQIDGLASLFVNATTLFEFQKLMQEHESYVGKLIGQTPLQKKLFTDFPGSIKSLGAWGGDFVLAASSENVKKYFQSKGYNTVIPFSQMI